MFSLLFIFRPFKNLKLLLKQVGGRLGDGSSSSVLALRQEMVRHVMMKGTILQEWLTILNMYSAINIVLNIDDETKIYLMETPSH